MDTASLEFIFFGLAVALISNLSRSPRWRSAVLLIASLGFLIGLTRDPILLAPLAGFLLLGYFAVLATVRGWIKTPAYGICMIVLAFLWLKKYSFLPHGFFLEAPYLTLGLSYIFFRMLLLAIEAADPATRLVPNPVEYLTYTLNFATFVSGPIQRYDEFAQDQFAQTPIGLGVSTIASQFERIIRGFFKVNLVALILKILETDAFAELVHAGPAGARVYAAFKLLALYPLFLYANFSGYIDIVIAMARLMRVRLPENFDRPFSASSFIDFWNRWHITLSTWLKTYVYNPLLVALMRDFTAASLLPTLTLLSLFVTFFLVGVWHGRTSEFILFGALQGGGVAVNKAWQLFLTARLGRMKYRELARNSMYEAFGRGLTFTWFAFTLVWFWATWKQIEAAYAAIGLPSWLAVLGLLWLVSTLVLAAWEWWWNRLARNEVAGVSVLTSPYARVVFSTALVFVWFVVRLVIEEPAPDIVYKAF